jgi:PAS domain S-box-containing protein
MTGSAAAGAVWGLASLLMFATDPAHQIFIAFVIAGVTAAAVSTLGASARTSAVFLTLCLAPLAVRLFATGGLLPVTMGFMTTLFLVFLVLSTRRLSSTLNENIQLRFAEESRQERVRGQAELLQHMGEIGRIGIWEFDVGTSAVRWSDELYEMYGVPEDGDRSMEQPLSSFPDPGRTEIQKNVERVIATGTVHESEQPIMTRTGGEIWTRTVVEPVYHNGSLIRVHGITQDITERRRVEVLKNEFVSTVSHELRTPLTSIRGAIGLISSGATGSLPDRAQTMLDIALRNSERLIVLINNILDIEKIESGETDFSLTRQPIMPLVAQAVESTTAFARDHGIQFVVSGDESATSDVDGPRLVQVLVNLLSNAAKFSPADSVVNVHVSMESHALYIAVTDRGPGIPADFVPRLFDKFSQADSSDKRKKGGTGLGLAISRAIAESMGGRISVQTAEGAGSTFTVELPRSRPVDHPATSVAPTRDAHLLLCVTEPDGADPLHELLCDAGYRVTVAPQVLGVAGILDADPSIDACILSIRAFNSHARWLREWLRVSQQVGSRPLIVIGRPQPSSDYMIGVPLPIVDWLTKPASMSELSTALGQNAISTGVRARILHVEDDPDLVRTVREVAFDYADVTSAATLREARTVLDLSTYDLVLLDPGLPDGSGCEILTTVVAMENPPRVVIFSATNLSLDDARIAAAALFRPTQSDTDVVDVIEARTSAVG